MVKQTAEITPGEVSQAQWDAKYASTTELLKDLGGTDATDADDLPESGTKKWAGEAGATADQSGAEIKTAYEAETNAYTDTKDTKLTGIEAGADVNVGEEFSTAEQTKLTGIATGAEVNPADLAALDSAQDTKLNGIADNATDDQTGAEIRDAVVALGDTERKILITEPETGEFKVIGVHRNAAGNLEYDYDDVAEG